ncbi:MAG: glycosyltransferase family 39 protein [Elusimicrobiota bacterium]
MLRDRLARIEQNPRAAAAVVFACALIARAAFVLFWRGRALVPDSKDFLDLAAHLAAGRGFSLRGSPSCARPPLYPFFLSLIRRAAGPGLGPIVAIQGLLDSLTAVWIFGAALALAGPGAAFFSGLAYAFHPIFIGYAHFVMSETLFFNLWFLFLALFCLALEKPRRETALLAGSGAVFGLALLCRPAHQYFPPLLLAVLLARCAAWKKALRLWIIFCAAAIAIVLPWTARNWERFHALIPISAGGGNAWWAGSLPHYPTPAEVSQIRSRGDLQSPDYDRELERLAAKNWKRYFWADVFDLPHRLFRFWITSHCAVFGIEETTGFYVERRDWTAFSAKALLAFLQVLTLAAGFFGAWRLRRHWRRWLILALPLFYLSLHIFNDWGPNRYHLTALPCLWMIAFWALRA